MSDLDRVKHLRRLATNAVKRCVVSRDYERLGDVLDQIRTACADLAGSATSALLFELDRWQGEAAMYTGNWEEAWRFRHVGLCHADRRVSVDDVLTVRTRCSDTSLTGEDVHLIVLGDNGLTSFGKSRIGEVTKLLDARLALHQTQTGQNFIESLTETYDNPNLSNNDFEALASRTGYLMMPGVIERHYEDRNSEFAFMDDYYEIDDVHHLNPLKWHQLFSNVFDMPDGLAGPEFRDGYRHPFLEVRRTPAHLQAVVPAICKHWLREAENELRSSEGLPRIGEGYISEGELHRLVRDAFPDTPVLDHARPRWLMPQHLDIYLPEYNIGIEYQGRQHDEPVEYFGGQEAFREQQRRDRRKRRLCRRNGCALIEVRRGYDPDDVLAQLDTLISERKNSGT